MSDKTSEDYKQEAHEKGEQVAKDLSNALNSMSYDKEVIRGFVDKLTSEHRTLQQSSMRAISSLIMRWAEMEEKGYYDLRNEATVKFCKRVKEVMEAENISLPFI
jgi:hypothetical protein